MSGRVIVITGVMAAGKSTVAQAVAERLPRSVHLRGDVFRRMIVRGRVEPGPAMPEEAWEQLRLRYRLAASVAAGYASAGFDVVYQDIVIGAELLEVVRMLEGAPTYVVVLDPAPEAVAAREDGRHKRGYAEGFRPDAMVEAHRRTTPRIGLWLDTTGWTAEETVDRLLARLEEARVGPPASRTEDR